MKLFLAVSLEKSILSEMIFVLKNILRYPDKWLPDKGPPDKCHLDKCHPDIWPTQTNDKLRPGYTNLPTQMASGQM